MSSKQLICIAGKSEVAAECLLYAVAQIGNQNVCFLPSASDGTMLDWQPSATSLAKILGVKVVGEISELYSMSDFVFISVEYDKIIDVELFASQRLFNLHFSALPKYRGVYSSYLQIRNEDSSAGVTLHKIDKGIDTGPILDQIQFPIPPGLRSHELYLLYSRYGVFLFKKNFRKLLNESFLDLKVQSDIEASYHSRKSVNFNITDLDFCQVAEKVVAEFRALFFPNFQSPTFQGRRILFIEISERQKLEVGQVHVVSSDLIFVGTLTAAIILILG